MKRIVFGMLLVAASTSQAQTDINLNLIHTFNADNFAYGQTYTRPGAPAVSLTRVQYYLSGFELTHDGGQTLDLTDTYVLASGNVTNYFLANEAVTNLEGIAFDLGVDSLRNHMGVSNWPNQHPLGSKSPSMDWGWPAGYFFWTVDGMVDASGNGTPDTPFEMHGFGDNLLRNVDPFTNLSVSGSSIEINLYVNIADWLLNNDLISMGTEHSSGPKNVTFADNTNDETVFTLDATLDIGKVGTEGSHLYADYTVPYAPTIYYDLATLDQVDVTVYDMSGRPVLRQKKCNYEGNFFIQKELETGTYIIVFKNKDVEESLKFIVQK